MFDQIDWQDLAVGLGLTIVVALGLAQLAARLVRWGLRAASGKAADAGAPDALEQRPVRVTRLLVFVTVFAVATRPILEMLGVELPYGLSLERVTTWLVEEGPPDRAHLRPGVFRHAARRGRHRARRGRRPRRAPATAANASNSPAVCTPLADSSRMPSMCSSSARRR